MADNVEQLAPAVRSILRSARERNAPERRLSVEPRSLSAAFAAAEADDRVPVIAEVKSTSPTTDAERDDDPVELARAMVDGGAAALSVLTEPEHFGGSPERLRRVRGAVDVPVLRKDFVVREAQLDTVAADVVLLIVRFVEDDLAELLAAARERGFQVLVEVHTEAELEQAVAAGADIVGVNNRDLGRLEVDLGTFERVGPAARRLARGETPSDDAAGPVSGDAAESPPDDVTLIAESGITEPAHVDRMREAGADGLLIGSAIMDGDVRTNTERFTGA